MNATKRLAARIGFVVCSLLALAVTGCRTHVVHDTRTVYVPTPPPAPAPVIVVEPPEQAPAVVIQAESEFYEPLTPYGRWVVVGGYGRCWIPARVEAGWRPYSNGYWQRTTAGWYWMSEEPWGWATYHYGRWDFQPEFGWIWVPHTQWAPAWVSWREGGGYVGWAPLRPSVRLNVNIGTAAREPAFESRAFVFVEHRRMLEPVRPQTVIVNNTTIINQTVNITNVKVVNKTVINEGPRPDVIERESGRKVQAVPVHEFRRREEAAAVARQRNIPTTSERKVASPARIEPMPAENRANLPPGARQVEKPAATQLPQPLASPVQPTAPQPGLGQPARDENKRAADSARKISTTPPTVAPSANPQVKPVQTAPPRPEVRPVEKPALPSKPATPPTRTLPVRGEKKPGMAVEKNKTAPPPAVESQPRREVRPETRPATKPPAKVEPAPPSSVKKQTGPVSQKPADKRLLSPKEKSRTPEPAEGKKAKKEDTGPTKQNEDQETPSKPVPTRPPR